MLKIHPKYLTNARLLALWREGLGIQRKILYEDLWFGFETCSCPLKGIGAYLSFIASEGLGRGLKLNHELIHIPNFEESFLTVSRQELLNEQAKLGFACTDFPQCNPVYKVV